MWIGIRHRHADLCDQTAATSLNGLWSLLMDGEGVEGERPPESAEVEFATRLARGTLERRERMDELIEECSTNWRLVRMPVVDRNILRLAVFEFCYQRQTPPRVVINEACELARKYSGEGAVAFVNGVLDGIMKELSRSSA